jgi:hypothetical protein
MTRFLAIIPLLLAATLTACSDRSTSAPTAPGARAARELSSELANDIEPIVVVGTGDPGIDVPAVQAAVDQGGRVVLKGHFSFDRSPTVGVPTSLAGFYPDGMVLVSKAATISGSDDEQTTIDAGSIPFFVNAPGQQVSIEGLRFVRPISDAILVYAVSGLKIAHCEIEGLQPFRHFGEGIGINTSGSTPTPSALGHPESVSGDLRIEGNHIDVAGATAAENLLGVVVFSVGVSGAAVDLRIAGNTILNATERPINIYQVTGPARIERNRITTSAFMGTAGGIAPEAIHITGSGSYRVAHNVIHSIWAGGGGIRVHSQFSQLPIAGAVVEDNEVFMDPPPATIFGTNSAAIDIWGNAHDNVIRHNRIRGRARAALAVNVFRGGIPADNALIENDFEDFQASLADVMIGTGVLRTLVIETGTIIDLGTGTTRRGR